MNLYVKLTQKEQMIIDNYHSKIARFLQTSKNEKIQFVQKYVISSNGISRFELLEIVKNCEIQFQNCLRRYRQDLKKIDDRKKLTYRSNPNIIHRNSNHSKFLIR